MNEEASLVADLVKEWTLSVSPRLTEEELRHSLAGKINELILNDFQQLVTMLYRIDVSEQRLKKELHEHSGQDAGVLIANLVIERQKQKIRSRQEHRKDSPSDSEEKW